MTSGTKGNAGPIHLSARTQEKVAQHGSMRTWSPLLLLLTTSVVMAQVIAPPTVTRFPSSPPAQQDEGLSENYLLTLTVREKETVKTELSLLVSGNNFSTSFPASPDTFANFTGTVSKQEGGIVVLKYMLGAEVRLPAEAGQIQTKTISFSATVRLQPGKSVEIMKLNGAAAELKLTKAGEGGNP